MQAAAQSLSPLQARLRRRRGFSLLELMIAISMLAVGLLGFTQALITAMRAQMLARQQTVATEAARRQVELMRTVGFASIFRQYNDTGADDLAGAGTAPGADFAVQGLNALPGDADGLPGEVLFPVATANPAELREDIVDERFGTPLDLDVDGTAGDADDHADDYRLLPVVVRVRWTGVAGSGQVQIATILGGI